MTLQTKSQVIETASRTITYCHPDKQDPCQRNEILNSTFNFMCKDINEDNPTAASKRILSYVQNLLAQSA